MIGVILTSHSEMALGATKSCDMVIGNHDKCEYVCLCDGVDSFAKELHAKADEMLAKYDEVIFICDLKGGTPYNQSLNYKLTKGKDKVQIVCGFNLPMLAELFISLPFAESAQDLAETIANTGKSSIEVYKDEAIEDDDDMFD